jgi:hypothetical protein
MERDVHFRAIYDHIPFGGETQSPPEQEPTKEQKLRSMDGQYTCDVSFYDDRIPPPHNGRRVDMEATGFMVIKTKNEDLWSPHRDSCMGAIAFDLSNRYEEKGYNEKQQAGFVPLIIFQMTDSVIIASGGGYLFGKEQEKAYELFSRIRRIPYIWNADGSITLKNFDITEKIAANTRDITFYPVKDGELPVRWYERLILSYDEEAITIEVINYIINKIMPGILKELKIKE